MPAEVNSHGAQTHRNSLVASAKTFKLVFPTGGSNRSAATLVSERHMDF